MNLQLEWQHSRVYTMSIRDKIRRLEKLRKVGEKSRMPFVVEQGENETVEQAVERVYVGIQVPLQVSVLLVQPMLNEQVWMKRYSPQGVGLL